MRRSNSMPEGGGDNSLHLSAQNKALTAEISRLKRKVSTLETEIDGNQNKMGKMEGASSAINRAWSQLKSDVSSLLEICPGLDNATKEEKGNGSKPEDINGMFAEFLRAGARFDAIDPSLSDRFTLQLDNWSSCADIEEERTRLLALAAEDTPISAHLTNELQEASLEATALVNKLCTAIANMSKGKQSSDSGGSASINNIERARVREAEVRVLKDRVVKLRSECVRLSLRVFQAEQARDKLARSFDRADAGISSMTGTAGAAVPLNRAQSAPITGLCVVASSSSSSSLSLTAPQPGGGGLGPPLVVSTLDDPGASANATINNALDATATATGTGATGESSGSGSAVVTDASHAQQVTSMEKSIADLKSNLKEMEKSKLEAETAVTEMAAMGHAGKVNWGALDDKVKELSTQVQSTITGALASADIHAAAARERISALEETMNMLQDTTEKSMTSMAAQTKTLLDEITAERDAARAQLVTEQIRAEGLQASLTKVTGPNNSLEAVLELEKKARASESKLRQRLDALESESELTKSASLDRRIADLNAELAQAEEDEAAARAHQATVLGELKSSQDVIASLQATNAGHNCKISELRQSQATALERLEAQIELTKAAEAAVAQLRASDHMQRADLTALRARLDEFDQRLAGVHLAREGEKTARLEAEVATAKAKAAVLELKERCKALTSSANAAKRAAGTDDKDGGGGSKKRKKEKEEEEDSGGSGGALLDMAMSMLKCSVCKDRFKEVCITRCFHMFCKECTEANLKTRHRKCPACGEKFGQDDVRTLYFST